VEGFGARLRRLRVARGLSCTQLASRVGVTESAIRQMESGQTKIASFITGLRIAKELSTTAWYLAVGGNDERERGRHATERDSDDLLTQSEAALEPSISLLANQRE
jgi:transcriptional regulator with XRE-family HTH domain